MDTLKIVVWDNIGNTLLGMRSWETWPEPMRERLLIEDHDARERVVTIGDVLAGHPYEVVWLYDPVKSQRGFHALFAEFGFRLVDTNESGAIARELEGADFLILHKEMLAAEDLAGAKQLRLIQHLGLDYRGVPMEQASAMEIPVAATPLVNYSAVAEHVWAMILSDLKRMADQSDYMQSRNYLNEWGAYHPGVQILSDLTLGLLGMGEIARPVAAVAKAFGMRTIYWDIRRFPELEDSLGMEFAEWEEVFQQSDVLSVQLALNEQTAGIIGADEFAMMKPTSLFINTARGKLVDEAALAHALDSWEIRAAAIDAFAEEPLPTDSPLHALHEAPSHRVILTPHSAAQGPWTWIRDSQELWFNIQRVLNDEPIHHQVTT